MDYTWSRFASDASAIATVTVAIFAGVQLWREQNRRKETEKTAAETSSALAYLIRRRLRSWLGDDAESEDSFETWIREAQNTGAYYHELEQGEGDFRELMSLISNGPRDVGQSAREAYVFYLAGIRRLSSYASMPSPSGPGFFDWLQLRHDAVADLRDCVGLLESGVIGMALLNFELLLERKRKEEEPFGQLARAIIAEAEAESKE